MAKIVELIETEERRGHGIECDPVRTVYQLWTKDGVLVFERDRWSDSLNSEFAKKSTDRGRELEQQIVLLKARAARAALDFLSNEFRDGRGCPPKAGWRTCFEHLLRKADAAWQASR